MNRAAVERRRPAGDPDPDRRRRKQWACNTAPAGTNTEQQPSVIRPHRHTAASAATDLPPPPAGSQADEKQDVETQNRSGEAGIAARRRRRRKRCRQSAKQTGSDAARRPVHSAARASPTPVTSGAASGPLQLPPPLCAPSPSECAPPGSGGG